MTVTVTVKPKNRPIVRQFDSKHAKNAAAPLISRLTAQAEAAARRGADVVRDTSAQLKEKASQAQETTVGYIQEEPMKAILIAAATGAALMGLISLMTRSSNDD